MIPVLHKGTEKPEAIESAKLASGFSANDRPQRRRRHEQKLLSILRLQKESVNSFVKDCERHTLCANISETLPTM